MRARNLAALLACTVLATPALAGPSFINSIAVAGDAADQSGQAAGANGNRLSFGSDLYFDRATGTYFGLADRGPGGGVISYDTRVQQFGLTVNPATGAISNFAVQSTTLFRDQSGGNFNGLNPNLLNGNAGTLGRSLDPEGFVIGRTGTYFVSDEYGPSVKEFRADGTLLRTFTTPANLIPTQPNGSPNFTDGRPTITSGRQDNRGFEGLTISPDGTKLYAVLQDPLVNEGAQSDGRRSQNVRMVEFDVASGQATRQFIYQLESLADINARIPGTADDFSATSQGRNIGLSAITALNDTQFLVLERDNRGVGVDNPAGSVPVGSKRVFLIDISGATDVSNISLAGTSTLPSGVTPVQKSLFLDIQDALAKAGQIIPEKIEGLTIGPMLNNGLYSLLLATDNDFSVTQNGSNVQFDVCSNGAQVALNSACPTGSTLLPSYVLAFEAALPGYVPQVREVPEPVSLALLGSGLLGLAAARRRRGG